MDLSNTHRLEQLIRGPFGTYAAECLKIRNKAGQTVPLVLTPQQRIIHAKLNAQKREKGFVRANILKGRQTHCSTYVAGRYYRRASTLSGVNVYILAHEQTASDTLFGMVDRYQRNNPLAPHVGVSNVKELEFDRLESSYAVATAGQKAGGRGRAISLFHGSEVAFWPNATEHFAASVQAVPLLPDTEIILESTANGPGGEFYERWQDAEAGRGDYTPIFIPWFINPEYQRAPEQGFELSIDAPEGETSESEYAELFQLSLAQMAWRRAKIIELRDPGLFRQEYPATPQEAFVSTGGDSFIKPLLVLRARKRAGVSASGPLIIGVDPAANGGDRFSVAWRRGLAVTRLEFRNKIDTLEGTAWLRQIIDDDSPARMNIDAGNIGAAIITNLKSIGSKYADIVRSVNFGNTSQAKLARPETPGPRNRRAEMWKRTRDWLELTEGVALPDRDDLQSDLTAPRLKPQLNNDFLLESKVEMKSRGVRSPDLADSVALTFAFNEFISDYSQPKPATSFGDPDALQKRITVSYHSDLGPEGWMA